MTRLISFCLSLSIGTFSVNAGVVADLSRSLGLTPETLSAAGCTAVDTQTILQQLHDATEDTATLVSSRANLETALSAQAAAAALLRESPGDPTLTTSLETANANLLTARTVLNTAKDTLRSDALATINSERITRVQRLISRANSPASIEFRVFPCDGAQFVLVERALASEARATRTSTTLPESQATLLTTLRADSEVLAVPERLESIQTIETAFSGF